MSGQKLEDYAYDYGEVEVFQPPPPPHTSFHSPAATPAFDNSGGVASVGNGSSVLTEAVLSLQDLPNPLRVIVAILVPVGLMVNLSSLCHCRQANLVSVGEKELENNST